MPIIVHKGSSLSRTVLRVQEQISIPRRESSVPKMIVVNCGLKLTKIILIVIGSMYTLCIFRFTCILSGMDFFFP